jgi:osmotically-inducible protein OsmY
LESEVTAALSKATDVDAESVTVSAEHGVVTLSGDVEVAGDRSAPQAAAHLVPGVTAVRNELSVLHARSSASVPTTNGGTTT